MTKKEQELYILNHYLDCTYKELGKIVGLCPQTIRTILAKNGLSKRKPLVDEESAKFIEENYQYMTSTDIGKKIGISGKQVRGWIGYHIKNPLPKRRKFNDSFFDIIDSPRKAYWIGFIYADGWICINKDSCSYEFGIELTRSDRYILEELNRDLGNVHIIYDNHRELCIANNQEKSITDTSALRVYSKHLVNGLHKNGIDCRKTKSDIFPVVNDNLFLAFLRGYIDGDGCIHKMRGNHLAVHITSGTLKCFEYIQAKLKDDFGIDSKIYSEDIEGYSTKYRIYVFRNDDVKKLLDLIYNDEDVPKLTRKYEIYKNYYSLTA